jgi:hypothetical protein
MRSMGGFQLVSPDKNRSPHYPLIQPSSVTNPLSTPPTESIWTPRHVGEPTGVSGATRGVGNVKSTEGCDCGATTTNTTSAPGSPPAKLQSPVPLQRVARIICCEPAASSHEVQVNVKLVMLNDLVAAIFP